MSHMGGKGTQLQVSIATTFVAVGQLVEVDGPTGEMGTREVTHLDSAAREFAATILDGGEVTGRVLYDPLGAGAVYLQNKVYTATPSTGESMKLVFSTTTKTLPFTAIPTQFGFTGFTVDDTASANIGLKVSGLPTMPTTT